jgi:hypothetical protein
MLWTGRLISLAVLLQTLELMNLPVWRWEIVRDEIPRPLRALARPYSLLLWTRIGAAIVALVYPNWFCVALLLLTTWLIAIRWRGTFNGGSDIMTFHILAAWLVSTLFPEIPAVQKICMLYIAVQVVLSYFVAGTAKLVQREWRSGTALQTFLRQYGVPLGGPISFALAWAVMTFEVLAPLALFSPMATLVLIGGGLVFHLACFRVFSLNRFFFVWLAAYPALYAALA